MDSQQPPVLAECCRRGLPVVPGFLIREQPGARSPREAENGCLEQQLAELERQVERRFGSSPPLLLTVSAPPLSGGRTPLCLAGVGLNSNTLPLLAEEKGQVVAVRACLDLVATWAALPGSHGPPPLPVPWNPPVEEDEAALATRAREGVAWLSHRLGDPGWFDAPPSTHLAQAVQRVSASFGFPVLVQAMPLFHGDPRCGCGTVSTRHRDSGEKHVSGSVAPGYCIDAAVPASAARLSMSDYARQDPPGHLQLQDLATRLEQVTGDMVEFDFVVTSHALWITDVRESSRTPRAAVRVAVDLAEDGVIPRAGALERVTPEMVERCFDPHVSPRDRHRALARGALLAKGLPLSRGAACGVLVADPVEAERRSSMGQPVVFLCSSLSIWQSSFLEQCAGLIALTSDGGSCAARAARHCHLPCVGMCDSLSIDDTGALCTPDHRRVRTGEPVTLDGDRGEILAAALPVLRLGSPDPSLRRLLAWADQAASSRVWVAASTAQAAAAGRSVGAEGIVVDLLAVLLTSPEAGALLEDVVVAALDRVELRSNEVQALRERVAGELEQVVSEMQGFPTIVTLSALPLRQLAAARSASGAPSLLSRLPAALLDLSLSRLLLSRAAILRSLASVVFDVAADLEAHGLVVDLGVALPGVETVSQMREVRELLDEQCAIASRAHDVPAAYRLGAWLDVPASLAQAGTLAGEADFALLDWSGLARRVHSLDPDGASWLGEPHPAAPPGTDAPCALSLLLESAVRAWHGSHPAGPLALVPGRLPPSPAARLVRKLRLESVVCQLSQVPATRLAIGRNPT